MARTHKREAEKLSKKATTIAQWLTEQARQDLLRFITCGSVDDGKSTLIGRLLWESRQIFDDQLNALQADSIKHGTQGTEIDFALLVDGLTAEREQGITIDVAYRFFSTQKRKFIVADTPGHEQYTRNMITGASTADVAILLIDSSRGILTQTRRHAYLVSLIGVKHIILAVNKMDLIDYGKSNFEKIVADFSDFTKSLGFMSVTPIPLSALKGDNITARSAKTPWYRGPTLMGCLETIEINEEKEKTAIFPVQCVNRPNSNFRGLCGTLSSGLLNVGDVIRVTSSGQTASIAQVITGDGEAKDVKSYQAITLVLDREIDASRGDILTLADDPIGMTDQFEATLVWMHEEPGLIGRSYDIKIANQWTTASVTSLKYRIDVNTQAHEASRQMSLNDIVVANFALSKLVAFEPYQKNRTLGGFILVDKFTNATVAAGMIRHNLHRAQNIHKQALSVTREDRERLNGHKGKVIWFTGLSGSGKSTIANALEKELYKQGKRTYILDGDNIRQGLNKDLGFTKADRVENIRRAIEISKLMMDAGIIVITTFISPFRAEREMAKVSIGFENFVEIFIDTPLEICEQRDPKGLYKKARLGKIPNMTGISSEYEKPISPSLTIFTLDQKIDDTVIELMKLIES